MFFRFLSIAYLAGSCASGARTSAQADRVTTVTPNPPVDHALSRIQEELQQVSCGGHYASSCAECPYNSDGTNMGPGWCNGECQFITGTCVADCWLPPDGDGLVVIPEGTDTIPEKAFYKCAALKLVKIPASVENIEDEAFFAAHNLKKVIFQEGSRLKGIGDFSFTYCKRLKWIKIPTSLKDIGEQAFAMSGLKKIIFKKGARVEVIGKSAFYECEKLKVVKLPASVKKIGAGAFKNSSIEKVIFRKKSKLETIGKDAFNRSQNFRTINIPRGVVIEEFAFYNTGCLEVIFTAGAKIVDCIVETKGLRRN